MRKTRCDAAQPKCGLCTTQNVDCVYRDARQPKIDYNTQVLLERMQLLEDRLLSTSRNNPSQTEDSGIDRSAVAEQQSNSLPKPTTTSQEPVFEVQIPLSHTANANHVFSWSLVQELLSEASNNGHDIECYTDATDVFFHPQPNNSASYPPSSWRLFDKKTLSCCDSANKPILQFRGLISFYFSHVNIFFPLLLQNDIFEILDSVAAKEIYDRETDNIVEMPHYGLLFVVLCLALLSGDGHSSISLEKHDENRPPPPESDESFQKRDQLRNHLWGKAKLVLGYIATDMSLAAAQSSMLAR